MAKPATVSAAEFTVTADVPVEVRINIIDFAVFTVSLPKLRLDALIASWGLGAVVPVPLRGTETVLPVVELLLMMRFPVAAPAVVGLNWSCSVTDWLGARVSGKDSATMVKPAPVMAAEFTVTADVPVDVRVRVNNVAVLTVLLPKFRLDALTVSWGLGAVVPVPVRDIFAVLPVVELLLMMRFPVAAPAVVGLNWSCSVTA
jgi:hypothetical protein